MEKLHDTGLDAGSGACYRAPATARLLPPELSRRSGCIYYGFSFDWELALRQNPYWNPALAQMSEQLCKSVQTLAGCDPGAVSQAKFRFRYRQVNWSELLELVDEDLQATQ